MTVQHASCLRRRTGHPWGPCFVRLPTGQAVEPMLHARTARLRRRFDGRIAQLVEQLTLNQRVLGSSPSAPTIETLDIAEEF